MEHESKVRSFKRRGTRITSGQESALNSGWPRWGIDDWNDLHDLPSIFGNRDVILEIGYGMGETTAAMAAADPSRGILAVDIHKPGAGALLRSIAEKSLGNVRLLDGDVTEMIDRFRDDSLAEVRVFFPDPWPKSRHHKRRLIQRDFVESMTSKLMIGGRWHCATDWLPYAEWMLEVFDGITNLRGGRIIRPEHRPVTRFEAQGLRKGNTVSDVCYVRIS